MKQHYLISITDSAIIVKMNDYRNFDQLIINTLFWALWAVSRPFVWIYSFSKWFIVSVVKETGNKMVKIVGGGVAIGIIGYFLQFLSL